MSGPWKSTGDDAINWTDFDSQTIECVLHYLYTGDYHVPKSVEEMPTSNREAEEICLEQPEGAIRTEEQLPTDETSSPSLTPSPDQSALGRPLTPISKCLEVGLPEERLRTAAGVVAEKEFKDHDHTVGMSVLVHAKVYSFAHCHFFSDLANFALQRLTQILIVSPCKRNSLFPYLANAIRHIYDTTPRRETQDDPARRLLSQYVALNYTELTGEELDALADEGGEFMVDVNSKLARRIATSGHCARSLENQMDDLTTQVRSLQIICTDKEDEIRRVSQELQEWENCNRGVSKKTRRKRATLDGW
jgi:hypothetical protein